MEIGIRKFGNAAGFEPVEDSAELGEGLSAIGGGAFQTRLFRGAFRFGFVELSDQIAFCAEQFFIARFEQSVARGVVDVRSPGLRLSLLFSRDVPGFGGVLLLTVLMHPG